MGDAADRFTTRQIINRVGRKAIRKLLRVGEGSPRQWYTKGIPTRHWPRLVHNVDWLTYEILEDAATIAQDRRYAR